MEHIRNFSIIAHIDHGKSTLADRFLLRAGLVDERTFRNQLLDDMDLEREKGITIKARTVAMPITLKGQSYLFNLVDTPGHVDFSYEVSRSLQACEGALLLVDAAQGIQAQTVANIYLALEQDLVIIPVLNKVDLPTARVDEVTQEIVDTLGCKAEDVLQCSAKTGQGVDEILEAIVDLVPPPQGDPAGKLRALVVDSRFDEYKGVITQVRMMDGVMPTNETIQFHSGGTSHELIDVGVFSPFPESKPQLQAGEVGYFTANIKSLETVRVGDTVMMPEQTVEALPGFQEPMSMVYCGLYPIEADQFESLRDALHKLRLNDASFHFTPDSSKALGFGFRCGFLGMLHMEIVQERLEREYGLDLIQTAPSVTYHAIANQDQERMVIRNPSEMPDPAGLSAMCEPIVKVSFILPADCIGPVMTLATERRGEYISTEYLGKERVILVFHMPLSEIIFDVFDRLKSMTRGYGTMDYELLDFVEADLIKMDILVNGVAVDALSVICHRQVAYQRGKKVLEVLKEKIPRHLFEIPLQAAIGGKIISRENIKAVGKNVTAKCYGGDITRKRKLLEKQKKGKKRMKSVGSVDIPQEAFWPCSVAEILEAMMSSASFHKQANEMIDTLCVVIVAMLLGRAHLGHAFVILTGSMAPTYEGRHAEFVCQHCQYETHMGLRSGIRYDSDITMDCFVCALPLGPRTVDEVSGHKILADKLGPWGDLERYDVVIFHPPRGATQGSQAHIPFIKRVVAFPGESVHIEGGDLFINGNIAPKPLAVQEQLWRLLYDAAHDIERATWFDEQGDVTRHEAGVYQLKASKASCALIWKGGVTNREAYNHDFSEVRSQENRVVPDLRFSGRYQKQSEDFQARLSMWGGDDRLELLFSDQKPARVRRTLYQDRVLDEVLNYQWTTGQKELNFEIARWDQRVRIRLDGQVIYDVTWPRQYLNIADAGVRVDQDHGDGTLSKMRLERDIYYTVKGSRANAQNPWPVPEGDYFVMGDNSTNSRDSRDWADMGKIKFLGRAWVAARNFSLKSMITGHWDRMEFEWIQ